MVKNNFLKDLADFIYKSTDPLMTTILLGFNEECVKNNPYPKHPEALKALIGLVVSNVSTMVNVTRADQKETGEIGKEGPCINVLGDDIAHINADFDVPVEDSPDVDYYVRILTDGSNGRYIVQYFIVKINDLAHPLTKPPTGQIFIPFNIFTT